VAVSLTAGALITAGKFYWIERSYAGS
jgi:hypothetical protein